MVTPIMTIAHLNPCTPGSVTLCNPVCPRKALILTIAHIVSAEKVCNAQLSRLRSSPRGQDGNLLSSCRGFFDKEYTENPRDARVYLRDSVGPTKGRHAESLTCKGRSC